MFQLNSFINFISRKQLIISFQAIKFNNRFENLLKHVPRSIRFQSKHHFGQHKQQHSNLNR